MKSELFYDLAMRLALVFCLMTFTIAAVFAPASPLGFASAGLPQTNATPCEQALDHVLKEEDWSDRLINPVLNNDAEIAERVSLYRPLHDCIANGGLPASHAYESIYNLTGYFLLIAGSQVAPPPETLTGRGYRYLFTDIQDPALLTLRNELGIPPPPGLVYVWLYPSVEAMPPLLANFFQSDQVRAVTLYTRYIIAVDDTALAGGDANFSEYLQGVRSRTLSHELVHAYINSHIVSLYGWERAANLPRWFSEGIAIHLSGSGEPSAFIATAENGSRYPVISYSPDDYVRYRDTFVYLEERYGRPGFMKILRASIDAADPQTLYKGLDIATEGDLMGRMETDLRGSRVQRSLIRLGLLLLALPFGIMLLRFLYTLLSKVQKPAEGLTETGTPSANSAPPPPRPRATLPPRPISPAALPQRSADIRALERMLKPSGRVETRESEDARVEAARKLGSMHTSLAIAPLIMALRDSSARVRSTAAWALGALESPMPVTGSGQLTRTRWLTSVERSRMLAELFHTLHNDTHVVVRQEAAASLYQLAGTQIMRPLLSIVRDNPGAFQNWFAEWAAQHGQHQALIDLYPWASETARKRIVDLLRKHMTPPIVSRLMRARDMGDKSLRNLTDAVLGPRP